MKKLLGKLLLWLFVLPTASLGVVYFLLKLIDLDISRATFILLVMLALILPGVTLAYGFKKAFGWRGWKELILGSFLSALIWTILAILMNKVFSIEDAGFDTIQALIFLLAYFIFILIMVQILKVLLIAKHIVKIRKKK